MTHQDKHLTQDPLGQTSHSISIFKTQLDKHISPWDPLEQCLHRSPKDLSRQHLLQAQQPWGITGTSIVGPTIFYVFSTDVPLYRKNLYATHKNPTTYLYPPSMRKKALRPHILNLKSFSTTLHLIFVI